MGRRNRNSRGDLLIMPWSPEAYHRFEKQNIIADLESQKVSLEEQSDNLSYFKSFDKKTDIRIQEVEKKLNEIKDTIKKLKEKK